NKCYKNSKETQYIWYPSKEIIETSNIYNLIIETQKKDLNDFYEWSNKNRDEFWTYIANRLNIKFHSRPDKNNFKAFDLTNGIEEPIYYPNCKLNIVDTILMGENPV